MGWREMTNIYGKEKLFPSQKFGLKNSFILCRKKVNMLILHEIWKFNERKIDPNKLKSNWLLTEDKNKETVFHLVTKYVWCRKFEFAWKDSNRRCLKMPDL